MNDISIKSPEKVNKGYNYIYTPINKCTFESPSFNQEMKMATPFESKIAIYIKL